MGLLDSVVGKSFRDSSAGRVVVFTGVGRARGYFVKSESEELKIRSFLKMFYFAHFSILILGMLLANAWSQFFVHLREFGRPAEHLLRYEGVYLGIYTLVVGLPLFMLWRSYRKALLSFVSAQDEVLVPEKPGMLERRILGAALAVLGLAALAIALFRLTQAK